ncbi:Signal transduction histidine kinase [Chelatococcus sambhunathii]|uniref:histidine kinase n=2 Tax=Chelatococcus TaxID=28209 RepID=A0AAC9NYL7_9HYPH|nr:MULTISPECIES: ATP-binding protein [Chelatococcus]APF37567.1 two-component sensor histidine kinase [Chelatococcus daeguensis]CUA86078.1 Signal transduction histidine kinase [Chelatococcus sambhunathii]
MSRLWARSLAAQIIVLMLLALALSQGIGFLISWDERSQALKAAAKSEFLSRAASLARVLEATPASLKDDILSASATAYTRFWISGDEPADTLAWQRDAQVRLATPLPTLMRRPKALPAPQGVEEARAGNIAAIAADAPGPWVNLPAHAWPLSRPAKFLYFDDGNGMGLAVGLDTGTWLNAAYAKAMPGSIWTSQSMVSLAITAGVLSIIAMFVARGIARPMRRLAVAAEALGRGESVPPLPESGPDDIRQTAVAFNRMQERLQRFVEDRTRMLAAIGHDLRTPLTSLRLRAEFVSDTEVQEKMLNTIGEMQTMTEATLAFAREEATVEATRTVDLSALVESLCDDLAELGQDVTFVDGARIRYRCRPDALRRAIRNLVENAVRYGERARVHLDRSAENIDIVIEDDGPGIPREDVERVFAPFFRMERSRNRETGGVGLGLSIARAIARHHGGDVVLTNRQRGLRAVISLPRVG